jgi:8-oxo-dGTP diphosphatase
MPPKHIVTAAVVISNAAGEVLLIKTPLRGWEIPGGQVEEGESAFVAAAREVREESGAEILIDRLCGVFQNVEGNIVNLLFTGKQVGGSLTTSEESLEVGYFPVNSAFAMITRPSARDRIKRCLNKETTPFCVVYRAPLASARSSTN